MSERTFKNFRGEHVPVIPAPIRLLCFHICDCGRIFVRDDSYHAHYALIHIVMALEPLEGETSREWHL